MKQVFLIACAAFLLGVASLASATVFNLVATIDASQVAPPTGSSATGSASMTYDDVSGLLSWDISWAGLSGVVTLMHFHGPAPPGSNAGVQVDVGAISGTTSPSIGSSSISAAQGADLLAELYYINIHTTFSPSGEIRGQVKIQVSCLAGTFLANPTDTVCTAASPGFFVPLDGATSQTQCPLGRYQDLSGAIACKLAPIGTYVDTPAATGATACPTGTTTQAPGATSSSACLPINPVPEPNSVIYLLYGLVGLVLASVVRGRLKRRS